MAQYCRYCIYLVTGNGTYCEKHDKVLRDSYCKSTNKCKDFKFCELDAYGETDGYKPKAHKKPAQKLDELSLF